MSVCVHKNTRTWKSIASLCKITKDKMIQISTSKRIKELRNFCTIEHFSTIILKKTSIWWSEILYWVKKNQKPKKKCKAYVSIYMQFKSRPKSSPVTGSIVAIISTGKVGVSAKGNKGRFWSDGKILRLNSGDDYWDVGICQNSSSCTFKICAFLLSENYSSIKYC